MGELTEKVLLKVDLDTAGLTDQLVEIKGSIDGVKAKLKELSSEKSAFQAQGKDVTLLNQQIVTLEAQLKNLNGTQSNLRKTVELNTQANKAASGSYEQLLRQWQIAQTQLKLLEGTLQKNADGTIVLTQAYTSASSEVETAKAALDQFNLTVSDGRTNVGNYSKSIDPLKAEIKGLRQEHQNLTHVMHGALAVFSLLNIAGGEGEKATQLQKGALIGLVAVQAVSQIRLGAMAALQTLHSIQTGIATAATKAQALAQAALNAVMMANPYVLIAAAIAAVVTGMVLWKNSTEDTTDALIANDKTVKESKLALEELKIEYQNLTGAISDAQVQILKAEHENEGAVKKIKDATSENLGASLSAWDKLKAGALSFFSPAAAAESVMGTEGFGRAMALQNAQLEAQEAVHQQKLLNIRTDAGIKFADEQKKIQDKIQKDFEAMVDEIVAKTDEHGTQMEKAMKAANDMALAELENYVDSVILSQEIALESIEDIVDAQIAANERFAASDERDKAKRLKAEMDYASSIQTIGNSLFEFVTANNTNEIEALEDKHRRGLISDKEYNRQIAEARHKQAVAEKEKALFNIAIQTIVAAIQALPNYVLAAAIGVSGALAAVTTSSKQIPPVPSFGAGGTIIGGKPHSQGGTKFYGEDGTRFEAEEGELITVINKNSTAMIEYLSRVNQMGGGVAFGKGGTMYLEDGGFAARAISSPVLLQNNLSGDQIALAIAGMDIVVRVSDINSVNGKLVTVQENRNI